MSAEARRRKAAELAQVRATAIVPLLPLPWRPDWKDRRTTENQRASR